MVSFDIPEHQKVTVGIKKQANTFHVFVDIVKSFIISYSFHEATETRKEQNIVSAK